MNPQNQLDLRNELLAEILYVRVRYRGYIQWQAVVSFCFVNIRDAIKWIPWYFKYEILGCFSFQFCL